MIASIDTETSVNPNRIYYDFIARALKSNLTVSISIKKPSRIGMSNIIKCFYRK